MAISTPLKQAESECALTAPVAWFRKEACASFDGKTANCISLSENWQQLTGHTPTSCMGRNFLTLLRKTDQYKFLKLLAYPTLEKPLRFCLQHAEGHWEWFSVADFMVSAEGAITLLLHRITEDVQRENALHKATQEAELALRGQSEFFAHISHELRTPLNAILGFAQMMHQGTFGEITNPRYRDYLGIMNQSGQELLGKINDLLEISSLCAGIDQLNERRVSLADLMRSVVDTHSRELFFRHIQVNIDLPSVAIAGDRIKLQQALSHLLKNALKFSPDYSTISLCGHLQEDHSLCMVISDRGCGFSEEQLAHFHHRKQSFSFLERNRKLFGFGLPLAEELIRLHDGMMTCRNGSEGGAEVLITLPAERVSPLLQAPKLPAKAEKNTRSRTPIKTTKPTQARSSSKHEIKHDILQPEPWLA